jgi:hypothetical protein
MLNFEPRSRFRSVDFPAFGWPTIATKPAFVGRCVIPGMYGCEAMERRAAG